MVGRAGHRLGGQAHGQLRRGRQCHGTGSARSERVTGFVFHHALHDGTGGVVAGGQSLQMAVQVLFDLPFGLGHEAQADARTQPARKQPDAEGACIPKRVEQTGAVAQFLQSASRPGQVVGFLACRPLELALQSSIVRGQRLGVVQRLGAYLADMVDAHQRGRQPALLGCEFRGIAIRRRGATARRDIGSGQRAQRVVGAGKDLIHT
jgi:hypothetical protein